MERRNGIALPNMPAQAPTLQVAAPMNDVQLVAMIAARQTGMAPADAVAWAHALIVEAAGRAGELSKALERRAAAQE